MPEELANRNYHVFLGNNGLGGAVGASAFITTPVAHGAILGEHSPQAG